jgi:hypothetical protein
LLLDAELANHVDFEPCLLAQLPDRRLLRRLARLDPSARNDGDDVRLVGDVEDE